MCKIGGMDLELRKLEHSHKQKIGELLVNDGWKKVMGAIPSSKYLDKKRFYQNDIEIVEKAANDSKTPAMVILIDEWSTMGKIRRPYIRYGFIINYYISKYPDL